MKIIGTRKMIVIMWCVTALTTIIMYYASKEKTLGAAEITCMSMITALGGVHTFKPKLTNKDSP